MDYACTLVEEIVTRLARKIRREREGRGWSLAMLARRAGVSTSMISKIERGEASPTAVLLGRLSAAFGMTISALLEEERRRADRLLRRADQAVWEDPATGYVRRSVCPPGAGRIEIVEVTLPGGAKVAFPRDAYAFIDQQIWMRRGVLHFREGDTVHVLRSGDHLTLGPAADCVFENCGRSECVYAVMVTRNR